MPANEGCALNPDGTFKLVNKIQWNYSPTHGTVQLPGIQLNSNGPATQVLAVNTQPLTLHTSRQPLSQSGIGKNKNSKKRKQGQAGGEVKVKKPANEGLGIRGILADGSAGWSPPEK